MKETFRRPWDLYLVALLLLMVYLAAGRLSMTRWTSEIGYVETVAVFGAVVGIALGCSRLGRRAVWGLALCLTVIVVPSQMANIVHGQTDLAGILVEEWVRLVLSFERFLARQPIYDPIFFVTLISSLYWGVGLYSGYQLIRGRNLLSILLPTTIPTLIVQYYDGNDTNRSWLLAVYFLLALLLIGRMHILSRRERWKDERVFSGSDSEFDLGGSIFAWAAAIVLIAWMLPTPGAALPAAARLWQQLNEPYEALHQWINHTLDAVRTGSGSGVEVYGNTMGLGLRANQGTEIVFSVTPPEIDFLRYYWQVRVYDTYEGGNWRNAHQNWTRDFSPADGDLPSPDSAVAQTASFDFRWEGSLSRLMVAPSQPVWTSLSGTIQYEDAQPDIDVTSWHTYPFLQAGDGYTARAQLLNPSISTLRSAGTDYPQWVTERYLQMPAAFSNDIRALAQELTASQATPYDKAAFVTDYLRREIEYSPNIAPTPPGIDPLEWFLFTWKSGYCNYYASAEVMILRSVGVPARMVVGYAQGSRGAGGVFTVRGRDSHAWPQVYFPGIGWVDFEPTASQAALVRPVESAEVDDPSAPTAGEQIPTPPPNTSPDGKSLQDGNITIPYQSIRVWVIIFVAVFAASYGIWFLDRKKGLGRRIPQFLHRFYKRHGLNIPTWLDGWERWSNATLVERSFHTINQSLAWLGSPQPPHATPAERAELLKTILPVIAKEIELLKREHEKTLFSPTPGDPVKAVRAAWIIRYQTARALLRRFVGVKDE